MRTFRAMGTAVSVHAPAEVEALVARRAAALFETAERRFSRFRADSELSRLNRARGPVVVSAELFAALVRARGYVEMTGGLFDPGVGRTLAGLGYDRPFAPGALDRDAATPPPPAGRFLDVRLDATRGSVERPDDLQIDLGGMIKGATVDAAAALLPGPGAIDAGGDAAVRGESDVEVEDPGDPSGTVATLSIIDAAVATSAPNRRRWRRDGGWVHHLVDPRTSAPAATDLAQVTVVAPSAELADVLAKTAFLLGSAGARRFVERRAGIGAVLVTNDGDVVLAGEVALA